MTLYWCQVYKAWLTDKGCNNYRSQKMTRGKTERANGGCKTCKGLDKNLKKILL
jgi:hypothetical protein